MPPYWQTFLEQHHLVGRAFSIPVEGNLSGVGAEIEILDERGIRSEQTEAYPGVCVSKTGFVPVGGCSIGLETPTSSTRDGEGGLDDALLVIDQAGAVKSRLLHGPGVDMVFAEEDIAGQVLWALSDRQGTVTDWVRYDGPSNTTAVADHVTYDAFGRVTSQSSPGHTLRAGYAGRYLDPDTGLSWNRARWYDPAAKRFVSEDPIGFAAGDANLYRYVGNGATNASDPSGLSELDSTEYQRRLEQRYRSGIRDLDELWRLSIEDYFQADPEDDWTWDAEDDMEEILDAWFHFIHDGAAPHGQGLNCGIHTGADRSGVSHFFGGAGVEAGYRLGREAQVAWECSDPHFSGQSEVAHGDWKTDTAYAFAGADFANYFDTWTDETARERMSKFRDGEIKLTDLLGPTPPQDTIRGIKDYTDGFKHRMKGMLGN